MRPAIAGPSTKPT
jgi:IS6 family transposase